MGQVVDFPAGAEPYVRKGDVAKHFNVHERTIERWVRAGMPAKRIRAGSKADSPTTIRFRLSECIAWVEREAAAAQGGDGA